MHTVRNRIASRPPNTIPALADSIPPIPRSSRQELSRLIRTGEPPAPHSPVPALVLQTDPLAEAAWPAPALAASAPCAMAFSASMAVHEPTAPAENRTQKRRNPKGKKARKAAARKAATAATSLQRQANGRGGKHRSSKAGQPGALSSQPVAALPVIPPAAPAAHLGPAGGSEILLQQCLQAEPALALILPAQAEPLVQAPEPEAEREAPAQPEPAMHRVLSLAAMPELPLAALPLEALPQTQGSPAVTLPQRSEPLVEMEALVAEQASFLSFGLAPAAPALAALADAQAVPLPRSHAIVPARQQGLVDVIAFLLRDSGRRLARWSARRHKSRAERDLIRTAEARQRALLSEFQALDALRRNRD